jgi:hypothetical protein
MYQANFIFVMHLCMIIFGTSWLWWSHESNKTHDSAVRDEFEFTQMMTQWIALYMAQSVALVMALGITLGLVRKQVHK